MKKPVKSLAKTKRKLIPIFNKFVRLRDCLLTTDSIEYGECISCDETKPFSLLDAGHYVPKKSGNYFSERGVNAQCRKCNRFLGGNQLPYRRGIIERYGEGVPEELEAEANIIKKYTIPELEELFAFYTVRIKQLEEK